MATDGEIDKKIAEVWRNELEAISVAEAREMLLEMGSKLTLLAAEKGMPLMSKRRTALADLILLEHGYKPHGD